ncbi:hypothetical protein CDL12_09920 [Handroanthus impetiginosus]|uniref:Secreted protein n=1 Tax=Handroanthus impetiginosus TaxID=429701 RepID=A0A2G9HIQ6_9LAMI|nr:hypothetical protein CDL12_09920 [Handroanthus impetiginosus]
MKIPLPVLSLFCITHLRILPHCLLLATQPTASRFLLPPITFADCLPYFPLSISGDPWVCCCLCLFFVQ